MIVNNSIRVSLTNIYQVLSRVSRLMPDGQMQQIIIALIFLRRIDCLIGDYAKQSASFYSMNKETLSDERLDKKLREISGGYPFYNISGYTFHSILTSNNSIDVVLNSYLKGFSKNVQEILEGMEFHQNMAVMLRQSKYFVETFEMLSKMDLSLSSVNNEEFIDLITSLFPTGYRGYGLFITSLELSKLICECLLHKDVRDNKKDDTTIYDPVCGTGTMLATAGEKAKLSTLQQGLISLYGQDLSNLPCAIAKGLILLFGDNKSKVYYGDTLLHDQFINNRFRYILADLPLGLPWKSFKEQLEMESLNPQGRFSIGLPSVSDSQFLFIEHILSKMDPEGSRAAFISSGYVLWGGAANSGESRIRRWLYENDMIETIMALPSGLLAATNIPIYLWILSNKKSQSQKGKVRLIDLSVQEKKNTRLSIGEEFVESAVALYKSEEDSPLSQIINNEQFGFYEVGLLEEGKKKETVTISLDTDIEQFIAKERQPFAKGKITVDYSSVEKSYSVNFSKFFKAEDNTVTPLIKPMEDVFSAIESIKSFTPLFQKIFNQKQLDSKKESWKELPLRAATDVVYGINRPPVIAENGLPILSVPYLRNPSGDERYEVTSKTRCASEKDVLVIVKGANTGEVFKGMDGILTLSLAAIKCTNEEVIIPQFLYYLIKGNEKSLTSIAKGSTIKSIDAKMIPDFKCLVPPVAEQKRLSTYLDSVIGKIDDVIETLGSNESVFTTFRQALIENVIHGIWSIPEK